MLACGGPVPPADIPERLALLGSPNLVLIVVDTLRADFTTPYGFEHDTSPELAAWATRGVLFEHARSQSSWTKISMTSLMTSLWPRSHGIRDAKDGLSSSAVTLAEALREAGYATYGVQTNGWLHQSFGFHQGFDRYMFPKGGGHPRLGQPSLWPHADRVYEEAVRLLDAHDRKRPFFLYLHFIDDAVSRVREKIADAGYGPRTLMVFAADHGETFGEHGVHGHARNVLTPVIWVPLILRFPFVVEPAVRIEAQVRNIDIAPTLLDLAGITVPPSFEGRTLVPVMTGTVAERDRPNFAALGVPLFRNASVQTAISDGAWTYARNAVAAEDGETANEGRAAAPGAEYLFDRQVDPGENENLIERETSMAARMRTLLDAHLAEGDAGIVEPSVRIDPGIANRLRAMGYLR
jgi:arylsulfatase A-like enzyme